MEALQQLQQQPMAAQAEHRVTSWQEAKRQPVLPQGAMAEEASMLRQTKLQVVEEAAEVHQASLETLAMGAMAACTVAAAAAAEGHLIQLATLAQAETEATALLL